MFIAGWVVGMGIPVEVKQCCNLYAGTAVAAGAHIIMAVGILMVRDLLRDSSLGWNSGFRFLVAIFVGDNGVVWERVPMSNGRL